MLCEYGCGQEAKYQLKNGKWCCCESYNKCPELRRKNSQRRLETSYKIKCEYCGQEISKEVFNKHLKKCNKIKNLLTSEKKLLNNKENNIYIIRYNKIILFRSKHPLSPRDNYEIHHIQPKCLSGTNDNENLICLTPREHYICHALLALAYTNTIYAEKLYFAFIRMSTKDNQKINSRMYEKLKNNYKTIAKTHQTTKDKIVINKDSKNKFIYKEELEDYLADNWKLGMIMKYNHNSAHNKGKIVIYLNNQKKFILSEELDNYLKVGWIKAKNTKNKIKVDMLIWVHNKTEKRKIKKSELDKYLKEGWVKGKPKSNSPTIKNKILINDNIHQKFIYQNELEEYLALGWKLGGIKGLKAGSPKSFRTKEHRKHLSESQKRHFSKK